MTAEPPSTRETSAYRSEDRSILLPYFKRFCVEPLLPLLPTTLSPNAITWAGLVGNLSSLLILHWFRPASGGIFLITIALVWFYIWCDNADGAHARRTGRASIFGEVLDHGLDLVNAAVVIYITAFVLGATALEWVILGIVVPTAASAVYWEQAELGVFRLGRLNQIESGAALTGATLMSAFGGTALHSNLNLGGFSFRQGMIAWVTLTVLFEVGTGLLRVSQGGGTRPRTMGLLLGIDVVVVLAHLGLGLSHVFAVLLALTSNVAFGMAMLGSRFAKTPPKLGLGFSFATLLFFGSVLGRRLIGESFSLDRLVSIAALGFALTALVETMSLMKSIRRLESREKLLST